jgi:SAM-dependent methyltransferase
MPMTQQCIRKHYEGAWKTKSDSAADLSQIAYSSPVEDSIVYPLYRQMIADLKIKAAGGDVLDVGSGSGRWIRFFLENYRPRKLVGADYTLASVELLRKWFGTSSSQTQLDFRHGDITDANLDLAGEKFDLINIANVLFHIPEQDLFTRALSNLAKHVKADGMIVTTEYLPRTSMRTEWMLVRDRYTFERSVQAAGLKIVAIKAFSIFSNDPMGIDGPDNGTRGQFMKVRGMINALASSAKGEESTQFVVNFLGEIERAVLGFCAERMPEIDMPSQKLVFLAPA